MPETKLYAVIKHMKRKTAQYFKKPFLVESRVQIESVVKTCFNFFVQFIFKWSLSARGKVRLLFWVCIWLLTQHFLRSQSQWAACFSP